ncbi:hypothetical protein HDU97_002470 [Phlyctochytrium planicorne]|nr:hypothetical protein HDU97_002470 [Phlyctochytrium planicorne]
MPEQTFSNPIQLDYMILCIINMYGSLTGFEWFVRPTDDELEWTISLLLDTGMLADDGKIAMELGRNQCSCQTSRFLIDVWTSKACTARLKQHCVIIAAMQVERATRSFGANYEYEKLRKTKDISEDIPCPIELRSLPSTIAKLNTYLIWRRLPSNY